MKFLLLFTFLAFISLRSTAQKDYLTWNEQQPLQWSDFAGRVIDTSRFDAESFAEVKYDYWFSNPHEFYFHVYANFNKNTSWCRQDQRSDHLLKHEQLHFNIAALYAKKLELAFNTYPFSTNYQQEILHIFNQKKAEYYAMQHTYDNETNHSRNHQLQLKWEKYISDELRNQPDLLLANK